MDATELSAIVTLILTLIKTAKYPAKRQKRFASTQPHLKTRIAKKGRPGQGAIVSDLAKNEGPALLAELTEVREPVGGYVRLAEEV